MREAEIVNAQGKTVLSKELLASWLRQGLKFMKIFQLGGAAAFSLTMGAAVVESVASGEIAFWYLFPGAIIAVIFFLIPSVSNRKTKRDIKAILKKDFRIIPDMIQAKDWDARKDVTNDTHHWEFTVTGALLGALPGLTEPEWDACEIGQRVYAISMKDGRILYACPEAVYSLDDELTELTLIASM